MAVGCLTAGILIIRKNRSGIVLAVAAHGMVSYSVLNAAGYYAERGEIIFPQMLMVICIMSVIAHIWLLHNSIV
jgi:hypothetical protein